MIEREFYIDTQFERFARLLESITSRYPQPDIFRFGERTYLTLQGAYPDYRHGRVVITGGIMTEDEAGNIINAHPNLESIVFETVAVRENRLKVMARCGFENVLAMRFEELLDKIQEAYPEARIQPLFESDKPSSDPGIQEENIVSANSLPDFKRRTLESRRAHLIEEFEAANAQRNRALSDVERLRLQRTADNLDRQIQEIDTQLQGMSASAP